MLVCVFLCALCTRDRGCSAHPAFPAPSFFGGTVSCKPRANRAARVLTHVLCKKLHREPTTSLRGALATKQSIPPFTRLDGLLRFARNDDGNIRSTSSRTSEHRSTVLNGRGRSLGSVRQRARRSRQPLNAAA